MYTCTGEANTFHKSKDRRGVIKASTGWNLKDWIPLQETAVEKFPRVYSPKKIWRRPKDGFLSYEKCGSNSSYSAKRVRSRVGPMEHRTMCLARHTKVYSAHKKYWFWPDMVTRIRKEVGNCAAGQTPKAKMARAHQHFRAKIFCTPGRAGIATSKKWCRVRKAIITYWELGIWPH